MSENNNTLSKVVPEIGIIGAGVSGLCAAIQLQKQLDITSFTLFEKNTDVGGTWLNNVYPDWSANYPSQPEILDYLKNIARKYNIYKHIKFQHEVKTVSWNEKTKKWIVRYVNASIPNGEELTQMFDILIMAPGVLRVPSIPNEFKAFTGPAMHTAEWNCEIDLKNKKIIPSIVDDVDTLHCYQRKPPYILPRFQFTFPKFIKTIFFYLPCIIWLYRCLIFVRHELLHAAFYSGSIFNKFAHKGTKAYRQNELKKHNHLWDDLTPKYGFGCKRVILSEQYYAAMARPNIHLHSSHIDKIVERTIYTKDGSKEEFDVLILATGFKVHEYFSPLQVYGKGGENILQTWTDKEPRSYYGIVCSSTPNLFALLGPNTALGHSSVVFMIECQVNFMVKAVREMMRRKAKLINVKVSAEDEFMDQLKVDLKDTVWTKEDCGSWYANSRGNITTLWGDNCINYWRQTKSVDWSKFEIK